MKLKGLIDLVLDEVRDNLEDPLSRSANWVFYGWPKVKITSDRMPVLVFMETRSSEQLKEGLGRPNPLQTYSMEFTIMTDSTKEFSEGGVRYAGYKIVTYFLDALAELFITRRTNFRDAGVHEVDVTSLTTDGYDPEIDMFFGSLTVDITVTQD